LSNHDVGQWTQHYASRYLKVLSYESTCKNITTLLRMKSFIQCYSFSLNKSHLNGYVATRLTGIYCSRIYIFKTIWVPLCVFSQTRSNKLSFVHFFLAFFCTRAHRLRIVSALHLPTKIENIHKSSRNKTEIWKRKFKSKETVFLYAKSNVAIIIRTCNLCFQCVFHPKININQSCKLTKTTFLKHLIAICKKC